jgi:hypothetical protein
MMNPRTHPRGAPPDFELPSRNPSPSVLTDAMWWLVSMRLRLEPRSRDGGTYADKPGSHNIGRALPDYGQGDYRTDHSIRDRFNRTGPWWRSKTAAHDWTFRDAQRGDFATIIRYTNRLIRAMRDPDDPRPDDTYFYTLGQTDNDRVVEGYNERDNAAESSSDLTHLWHRHDSFRRNIIGSYPHMWKALTIDMGWTVAEWRRSLEDDVTASENWNDAVIEVTASTAKRLSTPTRPVREGEKRSAASLLQYSVINSDDAVTRTEEVADQTAEVKAMVTELLELARTELPPDLQSLPGRPSAEIAAVLRAVPGVDWAEVGRLLTVDETAPDQRQPS